MKKKKYPSAAAKRAELEAEAYRIARDKRLGITQHKKSSKPLITKEYVMKTSYRGSEGGRIPSVVGTGIMCGKVESRKYTGTLVKGIATMHKSNAVPVINEEQMIDISRMRRG